MGGLSPEDLTLYDDDEGGSEDDGYSAEGEKECANENCKKRIIYTGETRVEVDGSFYHPWCAPH